MDLAPSVTFKGFKKNSIGIAYIMIVNVSVHMYVHTNRCVCSSAAIIRQTMS